MQQVQRQLFLRTNQAAKAEGHLIVSTQQTKADAALSHVASLYLPR